VAERADIIDKLGQKELVVLPRTDFDSLLETFEVVRVEDTLLAGNIYLLRTEVGLAVVEYPTRTTQAVIRPVANREAADSLIDDRLETYDRMWDGCGCRINYFARPVDDCDGT
jgi:hypothetical protein